MIYYRASELESKPFIQWNSVAFSLKELQDLKLEDDPLVLAEDKIPFFQFGVCPLQIVEGELIERSRQEMEQFEKEFNESIGTRTKQSKRDVLKNLLAEINLSTDLEEDTLELQNEYKRLKADYLNGSNENQTKIENSELSMSKSQTI
ncbi:hypothetical protein NTJ28_001692 [Flavobacterium psychrophilum]|nr:hypothetical protein [Flavobacterium psychrophilum]EKT4510331.1 hypothetical protein [Flavobacterium psychrophilum]